MLHIFFLNEQIYWENYIFFFIVVNTKRQSKKTTNKVWQTQKVCYHFQINEKKIFILAFQLFDYDRTLMNVIS